MRQRRAGNREAVKGIRRMRRAFSRRLHGLFYLDLGGDHTDTVFLAGSGRSGTTWLSDLVNHRGEYRPIFEPFYRERVGVCENFNRRQYLRADDDREEFLVPARNILSGRIRSPWTDRSPGPRVFHRRLIKDIRANLFLYWMHVNFPGMPIILLLRHPCAVAESRLALGWRDNLDEILAQQELLKDFLEPFEAEIRNAKTPFERHIYLWCIENYVPLMQFGAGEIHVAFYESLRLRPEEELRRLFEFLGREFDAGVLRKTGHPSALSHGKVRPVGAWRDSLDRERVRKAMQILDLFGLGEMYGEDPTPHPEGACALLETAPVR